MRENFGKLNIKFGWTWLLIGILQAAFIGMFAFQSEWLGGYASLTRRLIRLSHIAFMALSLANVVYGLCLPMIKLSDKALKIGSFCMIFAAISMPLMCLLAAFNSAFQNFFFIPVSCFFIAVAVMVAGQFKKGA